MKYQLLQTLLPLLEEYEKTNTKVDDVQHFAVWLTRQQANLVETEEPAIPTITGESPEVIIGRLLFFMTRYARIYTRKALEGTLLGSMDEFVYLAALHTFGSMTKSELIYRHRHEKPTGMDIIKRLLALGLIRQQDDLEDRRSKQIAISEQGLEVLLPLYGRMGLVSHIVSGNLSKSERITLVQLLEKLEVFHQVMQAKTKNESFEGMLKVVVGRPVTPG
ncbi:MAG: MarR family winged helix-turn-helix transcriptional regulator [Saprospiraceae bacterium]|jgi:DNA-binding MarR family transcriptional regulator